MKALHQMFVPKGNPTASRLFEIVAYMQRQERALGVILLRRITPLSAE